jgi:hypothetical protein
LRAYLQGEAPSLAVKGGINHYNAESVTARKYLSLEQSRKAYDTLRELVIETLQKVPPEMYGQQFPAPWGGMCTIPGIVKIFTSHELSHAKQIKKVLKSTTSL